MVLKFPLVQVTEVQSMPPGRLQPNSLSNCLPDLVGKLKGTLIFLCSLPCI